MATSTPWAIILCKYKGISEEPKPGTYFEQLFCEQGAGMGGLLDYWEQISYGAVELSGSDVFGWFQLTATLEKDKTQTRYERIMMGIKAAVASGVDLSSYFGIVVAVNYPEIDEGSLGRVPLDLGGGTKPYGLVVLDSSSWYPSIAAHEMGHGYGLDHAWSAMPNDVEYGDDYDIMGSFTFSFTGTNFGKSGPGINAGYLQKLGWLPEDRVADIDLEDQWEDEVSLAPLGNPEVAGSLAARVDLLNNNGQTVSYMIEYRHKDGWDQGILTDCLLIHEVRANGLSYLVGSVSAPDDQFEVSQFDFWIVLDKIDSDAKLAKVRIGRKPTVSLDGSVETESWENAGDGVYEFQGAKFCPPEDYSYERRLQYQRAQYIADVDLMDPGEAKYEWFLNSTPLDPAASSVFIPVTIRSALPPPYGDTIHGHDALITYTLAPYGIVLKNRPEDASYTVTIRVIAKDDAGRSASGEQSVTFEGDVLVFETNFYDDMRRCIMRMRAFLSKLRTKPKKRPRGGDPGPERRKRTPGGPGPDPNEKRRKTAKRKLARAVRETIREHRRSSRQITESLGELIHPRAGLRPSSMKKRKKRAKTGF